MPSAGLKKGDGWGSNSRRPLPTEYRSVPPIVEIQAERERRRVLLAQNATGLTPEEIRQKCKKLSNFVKFAWPILHPVHPYIHGWHIDLICKHLEAITYGKFRAQGFDNRLIINEPPGTMKSLLVNVFWTAWEWGPAGFPSLQNIATSYKEANCTRDCEKVGFLIQSPWYQKNWPMQLPRCGTGYIQNEKRGEYRAIPFGSLTQFRADRVKIDDPHSIDTAESEADRARATIRFRESVPSRVNDPQTSAIILIMQRLHQQDLSGVAIELDLGYMHLRLPMEYEVANKCVTPFGEDIRTKEGELLFPLRFPESVVLRDKKAMGSYATAGQFQQRPAPREGGMFKRHDFQIIDAIPSAAHKTRVRNWDLAASIPKPGTDPDWTVGLRMSKFENKYYIDDIVRFRGTATKVHNTIKNVARNVDNRKTRIFIPQEPGQAGKDQCANIIAENAGYLIYAHRVSKDKATEAESFAAQVEAGNVYLLKAPWNEAFLDELGNFPTGHDDQVDAASGAFNQLAIKKTLKFSPDFMTKILGMSKQRVH